MNTPLIDQRQQVLSLLENAYAARVSNLTKSSDLATQALQLSEEMDDKVLIGKSLNYLALFSMIKGAYKESMRNSQRAIEYFEKLRDERGIAEAKFNIAGVYYKTDNYHLGLVNLIDCITIFKKYHDYHNQARAQKSLGTIYEYFGDQKNAIKAYEESVKAAKKIGDTNFESNAYNPLSGIYLKQDKIEKALNLIEDAIRMKQQTGDIRGLAFSYYGRGKVFKKMKRYEEAKKDYEDAIEIHESMGEKLGLGMAYEKLAALYLDMGQTSMAKEFAKKAIDFATEYNIVIVKFKAYYLLYKAYKEENDSVNALESLELYFKVKESVINTQTLKIIENYELITKMEILEKEAHAQREKADMIEKKNRAEHGEKMKQEFLSNMSHEIRTPLNAIITIASLLKEKADDEDKEMLESLRFSGNNLHALINDILDFTKLDNNKVELNLNPSDFRKLLTNIKNTYEKLAKAKGYALTLKVDSEVADSYEIDETKLTQIIGNLVSNAIKFTEEGSVEIVIEKLHGGPKHDVLRFNVIDTGVGIPEHLQEEIFETYSQPKSITTAKHGGTGLGLAIVKKLVALHGSIVLVDSKQDTGSNFHFDLKLKKSSYMEETKATNASQLKGKIVLLAEDDLINTMVAKKLLANWGIIVEHAKNGLEAIEKAEHKKFDFILMDLHMPEMNGLEAASHIRKFNNPNQVTPIYALTADITSDNVKEYTTLFNGYLWKPIEIDKLYDTLLASL